MTDQTAESRTVAAAWVDQWERHREALTALYGADEFEVRQLERRTQLQAVDGGLLQRALAFGRVPGSRTARPTLARSSSAAG